MATTIQESCEESAEVPAARNFPSMSRSTNGSRKTRFSRFSMPARSRLRSASSVATWARTRVRLGQPLIGAGGKLVRQGVLRAWQAEGSADLESPGEPLQDALRFALLTNTVPNKSPGNKAYSEPVKQRFRLQILSRSLGSGRAITSSLGAPSCSAGSSLMATFKSFARAAEVKHASTLCSHAACRFPAKRSPALKTSLSRSCRFPIHPL